MSTLVSRVGTEFLVNTETGANQGYPTITSLASGGFVASWADPSGQGGDMSAFGIKAQVFDAGGVKLGDEFLVNTQTSNYQIEPTITSLASGGFVVSWTDYSGYGDDASNKGIKAQIFSATGAKVGGEFLVNTQTADAQEQPAISSLASGGFVVSWTDYNRQGGDAGIYDVKAQIFTAGGVKVGGEFLVNTLTANLQSQSAITSLASGGFVVSWTASNGQGDETSDSEVKAQIFDAQGVKVGGEFLINTETASFQEQPTITSLPSGGFVVSWTDYSGQGGDTSISGIKAQIFDAVGVEVGGEILVNTQTTSFQIEPAVTALASGEFVVSWMDLSGQGGDESDFGLKAQVFSAEGVKIGGEFLVNTQTFSDQGAPTITSLASGGFVVSWTDWSGQDGDASPSGIKAQIFQVTHVATEGDDRGADALYGTAAGETIDGLGGHDQIFGLGGADTLIGGLGDDALAGGLGADVLNGGAGKDTAVYSGATAGLRADLTTPSRNTGEAAGDTYSSIENLLGSDFNDTLVGNNSANILTGGKGNDSLQAGGDADILFGGEGDDNLQGQGGNDRLEGGAGNDILTGGLGGKDWFIFNAPQWGADVITDYEANLDEIDLRGSGATMAQLGIFQTGADVLLLSSSVGGGGVGVITVRNTTVDQLIIRTDPPATSLNIGLSGNSIAENSAASTVIGALSTTTTGSNTNFTYQLVDDADGRFVIQDDQLVATGTGLNFEAATAHNVQIKVTDGLGAANTWTFVIHVSDVNEAPTAVALSNTLASLAENSNVAGGVRVADIAVADDALGTNALGLTGADASAFEIRTEAGGAKALYYIGASPDFETKASYAVTVTVDDPSVGGAPDAQDSYVLTITDAVETPPTGGATEGDDRGATALYGTAAGETIDGLGGHDQIFGLGGNDTLIGGLGDDALAGGQGADVLNGGAGKDTAVYSGATAGLRADLMTPSRNTGEAAGDTYSSIENLLGSDFNDTLVGNNSANILTGGKGNDSLQAGGDADILFGGEGDDNLQGQGGNDRLDGGVGNDTLVGGAGGRDWFIFAGPDWGADTITDFEDNIDLLDLRGNGLTFAGLQMQQSGGDVLLTAGTHGTILILDEQVANLTSSDFLF